jgi:hypothetical protein
MRKRSDREPNYSQTGEDKKRIEDSPGLWAPRTLYRIIEFPIALPPLNER